MLSPVSLPVSPYSPPPPPPLLSFSPLSPTFPSLLPAALSAFPVAGAPLGGGASAHSPAPAGEEVGGITGKRRVPFPWPLALPKCSASSLSPLPSPPGMPFPSGLSRPLYLLLLPIKLIAQVLCFLLPPLHSPFFFPPSLPVSPGHALPQRPLAPALPAAAAHKAHRPSALLPLGALRRHASPRFLPSPALSLPIKLILQVLCFLWVLCIATPPPTSTFYRASAAGLIRHRLAQLPLSSSSPAAPPPPPEPPSH
ncbi:unnamed protein product [Closterium sp. NIES-64]|nr:unnamed protein product [Closterium sp. NIES-64]